MADHRTPEAKKWPDGYIPPQTCPAIDDAQNALELLRDTNSQLRHAALYWKRRAEGAVRDERSASRPKTGSWSCCNVDCVFWCDPIIPD